MKNGLENISVAPRRRPLQTELQASSLASKPLKTEEKYRKRIFFVI
jgi:hypothetical protein